MTRGLTTADSSAAGDTRDVATSQGVFGQVTGLIGRLRGAVDVLYREMLKFGVVGAVAFVVDTGLFNLLSTGLWPAGAPPLDGHEKIAKIVSASVATLVAWLGNRHWSFRHRRQASPHRELALFALMNVGGMLIALSCLTISHDVLHFTSSLADNISGNVVGIGLGTLFRFWTYRKFVFTEFLDPATPAHDDTPTAAPDPAPDALPTAVVASRKQVTLPDMLTSSLTGAVRESDTSAV